MQLKQKICRIAESGSSDRAQNRACQQNSHRARSFVENTGVRAEAALEHIELQSSKQYYREKLQLTRAPSSNFWRWSNGPKTDMSR